MRVLPLLVHNPECNILIRWPRVKPNNASLSTISIFLNEVRRSLGFVNKIRIENIELIALNNLGRRIIMVIMCLVVLVPLITGVNSIEILRLSRAILVMPPVDLGIQVYFSTRAKYRIAFLHGSHSFFGADLKVIDWLSRLRGHRFLQPSLLLLQHSHTLLFQ
uniref:Uncharacterized protein n=1 Tax=Opuntia streptacantha TaxID=393608 RepID=A0A7C8YLB4_OPUST